MKTIKQMSYFISRIKSLQNKNIANQKYWNIFAMGLLRATMVLFIFSFFSFNVSAQQKEKKVKTVKFEVKGVCDMCKKRIENAALIKGVKWVEWDKATDTLTVIYKPSKVKLIKIHESIAEAGHTTDKVKCNLEAYKKLPPCCAYMGDVEKH
ncbi:MAG: cation transporter [Bacteroidales bacterium]|nr:cation transporter [Bacteroidales bacterium]